MFQENRPVETKSAQRQAFIRYLRTGWRSELELKFNPYHDPRNGRFTFAPGGPRSLSYVVISDRKRPAGIVRRESSPSRVGSNDAQPDGEVRAAPGKDSTASSSAAAAKLLRAPMRSGGNSRSFWDPMTLQQTFPGLNNAPGGTIVAVADNLLDIVGPANRLTFSLTQEYSAALIRQIREIEPSYRFESLGPPTTLQGQINQINALRLDRAAALFRIRGETGPLQVETLRYLQATVDAAYAEGVRELRAGRLDIRLSPSEAVGNYVDRQVRRRLRNLYNQLGISTQRGPVRVIGREYRTSETDRTYRVPDARVGNVAFDITLTRKTLGTAQVRGFFNSDFRPSAVVIVRPRQLGNESTYLITRPGS